MIVVITGAAGFLGSHLVDRYLADGHDVIGIDNFITGARVNLREARNNKRFRFFEADVCDRWANFGTADLVLHFASPASPVDYAAHPKETLLANSVGTQRALDFSARFDARFLFASTSEIYGDPLEHPQSESYWGNVNPVGPRSCYDEAKRFGEAVTMAYARSRHADIRIVRIFNTYGPRMRREDGRVVPTFIQQALMGTPLTIFGDGSQTRSLCYVDDLVEGIALCASSAEARGLPVNLGNPEERTVREIAEIVCRVAGVELPTKQEPLPPDDPARRCPDIGRAQALLGWKPHVPLEEGLRRTIAFYRKAAYAGT